MSMPGRHVRLAVACVLYYRWHVMRSADLHALSSCSLAVACVLYYRWHVMRSVDIHAWSP